MLLPEKDLKEKFKKIKQQCTYVRYLQIHQRALIVFKLNYFIKFFIFKLLQKNIQISKNRELTLIITN